MRDDKLSRRDLAFPGLRTVKQTPKNPLSTTTGTKFLMAATGLALLAFLVIHLANNLLYFAGPGVYNRFSHLLSGNPLIYVVEIGLLAIFLLHAQKAISNYRNNQKARPQPYLKKEWAGYKSRKSLASTTMIFSGIWLLLFVGVHLWHFKFGRHLEFAADPQVRDLHLLETQEFGNLLWVLFYMISMVVIGLHLSHGFWSAFQSLGIGNPRYTPRIIAVGKVLTAVLAAAFFLIPLVVYLKLIPVGAH